MNSLESGTLICPEPGCRAAFKKPLSNRRGTRWLANLPGASCGHAISRPDLGGGPMSAQHRWLQSRLARICDELGFEAITEHRDTNSDVYVPAVRYSLEVQRWSTDFATRTAQRNRRGQVVWFMTEDAKGTSARRALFTYPAVRLAVVSKGDRRIPLRPWEDPTSSADAYLSVSATVAYLDRTSGQLKTGRMDAMAFLREILTRQRLWYPPGTAGAPRHGGFWAKAEDLESSRLASKPISVQHPWPPHLPNPQLPTPEPVSTPLAAESEPTPDLPTEHGAAAELLQAPSSISASPVPEPVGTAVAEELPCTPGDEPCTMVQGSTEELPRTRWWSRMFQWLRL